MCPKDWCCSLVWERTRSAEVAGQIAWRRENQIGKKVVICLQADCPYIVKIFLSLPLSLYILTFLIQLYYNYTLHIQKIDIYCLYMYIGVCIYIYISVISPFQFKAHDFSLQTFQKLTNPWAVVFFPLDSRWTFAQHHHLHFADQGYVKVWRPSRPNKTQESGCCITSLKFNITPKNNGWKTTLSFWDGEFSGANS